MTAEEFKRTFLPYHPKLYRIAFRLLGDEDDAKDMVQEVYIKLWEKRKMLTGILQPEAFAVTVVKNTCLDELRKQKQVWAELSEVEIEADHSLIRQIEKADELEKVERIIKELSPKQQEVLRMKLQDASDKEIEAETGIHIGSVKMIISRARKTIKERYYKLERQ